MYTVIDKEGEVFMKRLLGLIVVCLIVLGLSGCAGTEYLKGFLGFDKAPEYAVYDVGDMYLGDGVAITYETCEVWEGYSKFSVPEEGYEYIRVGFLIENLGEKEKNLGSSRFACFADGTEVEQHHSVNYDDEMDISSPVASGSMLKGNIYYKVPIDAEEIVVVFGKNNLSDASAGFRVK